MTALPKIVVHTPNKRPVTAMSATALFDGAEGGKELAWSLRLLSSSSIRLSLVRVRIGGVDPVTEREAIDAALGRSGMIARLADGAYAILLIGPDVDDATVTSRLVSALFGVLEAFGGAAACAPIVISALHRRADEIGDPEDFLLQLATAAPVVAIGGIAPVAA